MVQEARSKSRSEREIKFETFLVDRIQDYNNNLLSKTNLLVKRVEFLLMYQIYATRVQM